MKSMKLVLIFFLILSFSLPIIAEDKKEEKVSVTPYGYIKLDVLYETGRSSHGNYALWASDPGENDNMFYVTAKETRLGFAVKGFSFGKFKATGKIEIDFHSSNSENKAYNYMRHAYLQITDGSWTIIAGQTWDIICPLNAATLNYPVLWGAGNIGYRRPQLSVRKDFKSGKNVYTFQMGLFRTIAADYDGDGIDDGDSAGFPTIQGRIAGKFSFNNNAYLQLGISGHYGKSKGEIEYDSDSINGDFLLVLSPKFKIVAEYFSGKNLGTFLGGIAQSVNGILQEEIKAKGFFVNAVINPTAKLQLSLGYGLDDPDDDNLLNGHRAKNQSYFGNVVVNLSKSVKIGFEISNWVTDYIFLDQQKTLRIQNSWILAF